MDIARKTAEWGAQYVGTVKVNQSDFPFCASPLSKEKMDRQKQQDKPRRKSRKKKKGDEERTTKEGAHGEASPTNGSRSEVNNETRTKKNKIETKKSKRIKYQQVAALYFFFYILMTSFRRFQKLDDLPLSSPRKLSRKKSTLQR